MLTGQVSVWVPIVVGLIGVAGVVAGQLVNGWRERRSEETRWRREQQRDARLDRLAWRDKRLRVAVEFLVTLNVWRELTVDMWRETRKDGRPSDQTRSELHEATTRMSEQLAEIKLIGTERMRAVATETVDSLLATSAATRKALGGFEEASRRLSAAIGELRETFRAELGVTEER
jgi:hypothetical protein